MEGVTEVAEVWVKIEGERKIVFIRYLSKEVDMDNESN